MLLREWLRMAAMVSWVFNFTLRYFYANCATQSERFGRAGWGRALAGQFVQYAGPAADAFVETFHIVFFVRAVKLVIIFAESD